MNIVHYNNFNLPCKEKTVSTENLIVLGIYNDLCHVKDLFLTHAKKDRKQKQKVGQRFFYDRWDYNLIPNL